MPGNQRPETRNQDESEDGKDRNDNITSQAVTRFQNHYDDDSIKRLDIFHYVYAMLHHPAYRARYGTPAVAHASWRSSRLRLPL